MSSAEAQQRAVRTLGVVVAVVGVLLLVNVSTVHALNLGGERYEYEALPVDPGGEYLFPGGSPDHLDDIGCLYERERDRLCAFEQWILERQPASNESAPTFSLSLEESVRTADAPPYVFHQGDFYPYNGRFYRRTDQGTEGVGIRL